MKQDVERVHDETTNGIDMLQTCFGAQSKRWDRYVTSVDTSAAVWLTEGGQRHGVTPLSLIRFSAGHTAAALRPSHTTVAASMALTALVLLLLAAVAANSCNALNMRSVATLALPWTRKARQTSLSKAHPAQADLEGGLPRPTFAGYLPLRENASMYYAFYEAFDPAPGLLELDAVPLVLWLQVSVMRCIWRPK